MAMLPPAVVLDILCMVADSGSERAAVVTVAILAYLAAARAPIEGPATTTTATTTSVEMHWCITLQPDCLGSCLQVLGLSIYMFTVSIACCVSHIARVVAAHPMLALVLVSCNAFV